jgi:hypothetical protein
VQIDSDNTEIIDQKGRNNIRKSSQNKAENKDEKNKIKITVINLFEKFLFR